MATRSTFLGGGLFKLLALGIFVAAVGAIFFFVIIPSLPKGEVHITMWTSGEKLNYLKDTIAQFNTEKHTLPSGGKKIQVEVYTVNSGTMSDYLVARIRDGTDFPPPVTPPHIVSPSVDHWLTRVNFLTGIQAFDLEQDRKSVV